MIPGDRSGLGLAAVDFLQLLANAVTLEVGQVINEKLTVEVITLMLDADCQQAVVDFVKGVAVAVQCLDADTLRALDVLVEAGHREAAFLHLLQILGQRLQFGVDEHPWFGLVLGDVDHDDTLMDVDLGRRQPDAGGVVHGLEHVVDKLGRAYSTGKRKNAIARVWVKPGSGKITVNGRELDNNRPETIRNALQIVSEGDTSLPLTIIADANARYQAVVTAMDVAGKLGFVKITIATVNDPAEQ